MRLAFSNIAWAGAAGDQRAAPILRSAGIEGVEIAPTAVWPDPLAVPPDVLDAYRAHWHGEGLRLVALQALLYGHPELGIFGTPDVQAATLGHLEGMCALAARLGAGALVFGSPRNRARGTLGREEAVERAIDFFGRAATLAHGHGVAICLEGNPPQYGCDFVTTTAEALELVATVNRAGFALQLDGGALTLNGEEPAAAVARAGTWLRHVHASEPHLVPFGEGGTDHAAIAGALVASKYAGWVSVEMRAPATGDPVDRLARACRDFSRTYAGRPAQET
jgi:D-psicose/D-tagatose/L-ribulose 3-epimerase